jgi:crotonobetainyl-CoA:carnitine CoA-transferase CaiB-like acyl-CoA transferase
MHYLAMAPLRGIRVLDLSRVLAGPFCTMSLGDLGAEIIKVEEPGSGDETRNFGPPFVRGVSTYFLSINRNKKSLAVNLKHPEGLRLVQALARRSDVVVENFRPGVAERLGLGPERLRADNPRLIYCSISGFGHEGLAEYSKLPGYDAVMQGLAGLQHLTGQPGGPPTKVGVSIADILTGMTAMQAILLALYSRERSGTGSRLDISMFDSTVQALTFQAAAHLIANRNPGRLGNRHASIVPYETFQAKDGYLNLAVANDGQFKKLCQLLGTPALAEDPRFAQNRSRVENREELVEKLGTVFRTRPVQEWVQSLQAAGIPAGAILDLSQLLAHPQLAARGILVSVDHPVLGRIQMVGSPIKALSLDDATDFLPPPALGEHTEQILTSVLGLDSSEVQRLIATGAVAVMSEEPS